MKILVYEILRLAKKKIQGIHLKNEKIGSPKQRNQSVKMVKQCSLPPLDLKLLFINFTLTNPEKICP